MMLHVEYLNEIDENSSEFQELLSNVLEKAAEMEETGQAEVSVTIVTKERIQEINNEYRQKDSVTDVISFAMEEMGEDETEIIGGEETRFLGDIIICLDVAKEQAAEYGHSLEREMGFLAVHGFLHLLGYDHMNDEDEKRMFGRQEEILEQYGLKR
ncbi:MULTISPECIES: rRNA maturation RNase YbeY [Fictibacillus]|jgi:probable rRNA maturation factor|uniref:rRNA maturation RNase YbeY n=1 Tax=Fictibacillus TaxID=1329200 RepID=UPI0018CD16D4|nr:MULTISPECIES: rRNA maturation RNase YbeY [unclassified Fictibacillus]MBH0160058.1 rRNA maturation RNase YbeY [Fictibacillus sp. 26RED30]MBH0166349.1 rRNA maturation RNase YbeY [Fictibacillus sp. 7GRE50]MBH0174641.1 rRNA maturation RNase YbeY [Fictibacillus sp. 23RED33]